jgi:transcriptional regulator with XRE-family HTH domain
VSCVSSQRAMPGRAEDLARLLRLGANTVSRWESGRNVQTAAMDILLRLIRDLPGSIDYLREHAA